jgi:hypothetical protein
VSELEIALEGCWPEQAADVAAAHGVTGEPFRSAVAARDAPTKLSDPIHPAAITLAGVSWCLLTPNHRAHPHVYRLVGTGGTEARPAIMFRDRRAFWFGTGAVIAGVALHLPMFLGARFLMGMAVGGMLPVLGVGVVVVGIAPPDLRGAALLGAVPVALAALAVGRFGIETRRRGLEEITELEPQTLEAR